MKNDDFNREWYGRMFQQDGQPRPRQMSTDKNAQIADYAPHYTNSYFKTARVVWGREEKGLSWDYSDRIWEWDYEKAEQSAKLASEKHPTRTAAWVEVYLSAFFGKDIEVVCIMAGFNVSNGYPYQVFGYKEKG